MTVSKPTARARGLTVAASGPPRGDALTEPAATTTAPAATDGAKGEKWPARISMTASGSMKYELEAARLNDGIEVTARLRGMIELWRTDPEVRARVDDLAKRLR